MDPKVLSQINSETEEKQMTTTTLASKEVEITEEGFLANPEDWTEEMAE